MTYRTIYVTKNMYVICVFVFPVDVIFIYCIPKYTQLKHPKNYQKEAGLIAPAEVHGIGFTAYYIYTYIYIS